MTTDEHAVVHLLSLLTRDTPTRASIERFVGAPLAQVAMGAGSSREEYRGTTEIGDPPIRLMCSLVTFPAEGTARVDFRFNPPTPSDWWSGLLAPMGIPAISVAPLAFVAPGLKGGPARVTSLYRLDSGTTLGLLHDDEGRVVSASVEWKL